MLSKSLFNAKTGLMAARQKALRSTIAPNARQFSQVIGGQEGSTVSIFDFRFEVMTHES
jgi:hypothetical protein